MDMDMDPTKEHNVHMALVIHMTHFNCLEVLDKSEILHLSELISLENFLKINYHINTRLLKHDPPLSNHVFIDLTYSYRLTIWGGIDITF